MKKNIRGAEATVRVATVQVLPLYLARSMFQRALLELQNERIPVSRTQSLSFSQHLLPR